MSGMPHDMQKRASGKFSFPQLGHVTTAEV
jgi:hypothetical protein